MKEDVRLLNSVFKKMATRVALIAAVVMMLGIVFNYNQSLIYADHDKDEQAEHEDYKEKHEYEDHDEKQEHKDHNEKREYDRDEKTKEENKYDEDQASYAPLSQDSYNTQTDAAVTLQVDTHDPVKLTGFIQDSIVYLPAVSVLEQLNIEYVWYENIDALEMFIPEKTASGRMQDCIFRSEQNVIFVDGNKYEMRLAPLMKGNQLYVSAKTLALLTNYQMTKVAQSDGWLMTWKGEN
ncbi:hypothetical protein [Paenibacillus marinisediminis]